ncbi:MAG: fructose-6-phosphate aldolase [Candidatus Solincola sediminis]|uniref:Probable transaldolase n=1 Tax=Candidatus Solincola sediminis TaxID=1797199 RepID=A0A1F2WF47_9ACTN|nr:MAG: fructose-6-phosphate aldolase [Candidatus Solincola sediminis]OFW57839.1 MAG: fructose-6-phosphate aldolase [Candidatus Solincola sediminis]
MKIFLDTANVDQIREINDWGILQGVTTNPSLVSKEGRCMRDCLEEIATILRGPISAEAMSMDTEGMVREARELAGIAENINVKIPMTAQGLAAVSRLSKEGIKTNVTLVFSTNQALLAAAAGATFVSPFVGRLDDIGNSGMAVVEETVDVFDTYSIKTQVIAASLRHPMHVTEAARAGAHIATIPYDVIVKMIRHPLTDLGIQRFLEDYEKIKDL